MTFNAEPTESGQRGKVYLVETARDDIPPSCADNFFDPERYRYQNLILLGSFETDDLKPQAPALRAFEVEDQGQGLCAAVHLEICVDDAPHPLPRNAPLLKGDRMRASLDKLPVMFFELPDLASAGFPRHPRTCGTNKASSCGGCKAQYNAAELAELPSFWRIFGYVALVGEVGGFAVRLTILKSSFTLQKAMRKKRTKRKVKGSTGALVRQSWSAGEELHVASRPLRQIPIGHATPGTTVARGPRSQTERPNLQLERTQSQAFPDVPTAHGHGGRTSPQQHESESGDASSFSDIVASSAATDSLSADSNPSGSAQRTLPGERTHTAPVAIRLTTLPQVNQNNGLIAAVSARAEIRGAYDDEEHKTPGAGTGTGLLRAMQGRRRSRR
ncbi:hypothetical protein LTR95_008286 [Oleoguttula sp. CCFEE 5521]